MEDFAQGDVVRLNGDGPEMIIVGIRDDGRIECVWTEDGEERRGIFIPATVEQPGGDDIAPGFPSTTKSRIASPRDPQ